MGRFSTGLGVLIVLLMLALGTGGCAQSRAEKLADRAEGVEKSLVKERDRVLEEASGAERSARIDHLQKLQLQLRAANISRAVAPRLLEGEQVDMAYDVLDEVYGTINWNIPLEPGDAALKPLPSLFGPAGLDFDSLAPGASRTKRAAPGEGAPVTPP